MNNFSINEFHERICEQLDPNGVDLEWLSCWYHVVNQFHTKRLIMIKHKQTKFIHQINNLMNKIISTEMDIDLTCCRSISQANLDIVNQVNELNWHFNQWTQHKNTFQDEQKQKAKRIYAWSGYFKAVAALLRTINPHTVICSIKPMVPPCDRYFYELLTTHLKHDYTSVPPKTTPFNTHLTQFMRQWTQQEGITVKIEGKEYLEAIDHAHDSTINLFLPSHRSPIPDAMLMSHLDLPHFILFGNPAMFAVPEKMQYWLSWIPETIRDSLGINPENLKQEIASLPEFISIGTIKNGGRGSVGISPIEKLIQSLKAGISHNIINYPQGFVPSAGEVLPISNSFVNKLLAPLILNDFIVRIFPIAYEVESEFLLNKTDHKGMTYTIKCGKALEFEAVKFLVQQQLGSVELKKENLEGLMKGTIGGDGLRYFDHYLLSFWYENITQHKELSLEEMIARADHRFGFKLNLSPYKNIKYTRDH